MPDWRFVRVAFLCATMNGDSEIENAAEMKNRSERAKIIESFGIAIEREREGYGQLSEEQGLNRGRLVGWAGLLAS